MTITWIFAIQYLLSSHLFQTVVAHFLPCVLCIFCHFKSFAIILAEYPIICCTSNELSSPLLLPQNNVWNSLFYLAVQKAIMCGSSSMKRFHNYTPHCYYFEHTPFIEWVNYSEQTLSWQLFFFFFFCTTTSTRKKEEQDDYKKKIICIEVSLLLKTGLSGYWCAQLYIMIMDGF